MGGQKPDKSGRYEANMRWTGVLQDILGESYYIIEEGLGSRITDLEYDCKPADDAVGDFELFFELIVF